MPARITQVTSRSLRRQDPVRLDRAAEHRADRHLHDGTVGQRDVDRVADLPTVGVGERVTHPDLVRSEAVHRPGPVYHVEELAQTGCIGGVECRRDGSAIPGLDLQVTVGHVTGERDLIERFGANG